MTNRICIQSKAIGIFYYNQNNDIYILVMREMPLFYSLKMRRVRRTEVSRGYVMHTNS